MTGEADADALAVLPFVWAQPAKNSSKETNTIVNFFIVIFIIFLSLRFNNECWSAATP
jgi:large-conductance mechanosensitive channel